jgi:hypothetical protein
MLVPVVECVVVCNAPPLGLAGVGAANKLDDEDACVLLLPLLVLLAANTALSTRESNADL